MKRIGKTSGLYEKISSTENIELAIDDTLKPHRYYTDIEPRYNQEQLYVINNRPEVVKNIQEMLLNETYEFHELKSKKVFEPKERDIHFPIEYPDKIILAATYRVLRDVLYTKFVRNTYNCIKGRGIIDAKNAIEKIMREHPGWYYVKTDVKKFYPTLRHNVVKNALKRVFKDERILRLLFTIIDNFHETICDDGVPAGLAIGVNLSQLLAILALMPIVRQINEVFKYPCVDFTDDIFTAVPTKEDAHRFVKWYINESEKYGMTVKPNYRIAPMTCPLIMIGYKFCVTKDGDQYTLLSRRIKNRMKKRNISLEKRGISDKKWKQKMASYYGWCKHASCYRLMESVFGDRNKLFNKKNMERLSDLKKKHYRIFNLDKDAWVSIDNLYDIDICFYDVDSVEFSEKDKDGKWTKTKKTVFKFTYQKDGEPDGDLHYSITASESLRDRLQNDKDKMPFIAQINKAGTRRKYLVLN